MPELSTFAASPRDILAGAKAASVDGQVRIRCRGCGRFRDATFANCRHCGTNDATMNYSVRMAMPADRMEISFIIDKDGDIDKSTIYAGPLRPPTNPVDAAVDVLSRRQQ